MTFSNYFIVNDASVSICSCVSCVCQLPMNKDDYRVVSPWPWPGLKDYIIPDLSLALGLMVLSLLSRPWP